MITTRDRQLAILLVRTGMFRLQRTLFRCVDITPSKSATARRLFDRMKAAQVLDSHKHAPCCPANHWCGTKLVFQRCNCGAAQQAREVSR